MVSNCSLYPLDPVDPALDPAYRDGRPPRPRSIVPTGEMPTEWPIVRMPSRLERVQTISLEVLEDEIERQAAREEAFS